MNRQSLPEAQGFPTSANLRASFGAPPEFVRLSGPGTLVRLVPFGPITPESLELKDTRSSGCFWLDEELLLRLLQQARSELTQQESMARKRRSAPPFNVLLGNHVRQCLRENLAICRDWTPDFNAFLRLHLTPEDSLTVLAGPVGRQAQGGTPSAHGAPAHRTTWLMGQALQYVIDFGLPGNRTYTGRILGPFLF